MVEGGIWRVVLDFLFPMPCMGCGLFVDSSDSGCVIWCTKCEIMRLNAGICTREIAGAQVFSATSFEVASVRRAIHTLKYKMIWRAGEVMGQWMHDCLPPQKEKIILVPIPLLEKRLALRGFNQSEILAQGILRAGGAENFEIKNILVRARGRGQQAHRSRQERLGAMQGAFIATEKIDPAVQYCIVDDVLTTGSTMTAAIEALHHVGVEKICGVVVAAV